MLSKRVEKIIKSLKVKKYRHNHGLYIAEGSKVVEEIISGGSTPIFLVVTENTNHKFQSTCKDIYIVDSKAIKDLSQLTTPNEVIAVFEIPDTPKFTMSEITLVLDGINDPGNMGTIIRTADWFGIKNIVCSKETVDIYNAKTIQSTMGSIGRVNVYYKELAGFIEEHKNKTTVYGTTLEGEALETSNLSLPALIVVGNESHGISSEINSLLDKRITISKKGKTESLNAAIATSIVCYQFSLLGGR